jgi:hypothetical protein
MTVRPQPLPPVPEAMVDAVQATSPKGTSSSTPPRTTQQIVDARP